MPQNFTIDDTDATLVYGPGWGVESPNDPALDNYFQSTYHASQTSGANVNLSFSGVAINLFGSTGPNHGNFSVRYDNFIQLLSAQADTLSYRQLLFSAKFPAGDHSITLTNTDNNQSWLDLDFVTVEGAGKSSVPSAFSSTISPPSVSLTTMQFSSLSPAPSTSPVQNSSQSNNKSNSIPLVLAIVFGVLLFLLVVGVAGYLIRRAHHRRAKASPRVFGAGSVAFHGPQFNNMTPFSPHPSTYDTSPLGSPRTVFNGAETQQQGSDTPRSTVPATRPWSPFSTPIGRIFGTTKDGADSMKSTFLKV